MNGVIRFACSLAAKACVLFALSCAWSAWAGTWTDPNTGITWTYTVSNGKAMIYNDWAAAIPTSTTGAINIPSTLGGYPVTRIGDYAFSDCSWLTSVTIPDSVTSIGDYAFERCSGLTSMTIPISVTSIGAYAFFGCSGLTNITIPDGVTNIDNGTFYGCSGLTDVEIPLGVTNLHVQAFACCSGLTSVTIPDGVTCIRRLAFEYCTGLKNMVLSSHVTDIEDGAFFGCSGLESFVVAHGNSAYKSEAGLLLTKDGTTLVCGVNGDVTIPDGVTHIAASAFRNCRSLTSVKLPSGTTTIGNDAFWCCESLTNIEIPDSVTSIGSGAFWGCNGLLFDITTIPGVKLVDGWVVGYESSLSGVAALENIRGIGEWAFSGCSGLTNVIIPESVTNIAAYSFNGCYNLEHVQIPDGVVSIGDSAFNGCSKLSSVLLPEIVTYIGERAFNCCESLTDVRIPDGVADINDRVFHLCENLTNVTLSVGTTNIGWAAFEDCKKLTSIVVPDGVTSIGNGAFSGCSGLTSVTIPAGVTKIGDGAFSGCTNVVDLTASYIPFGMSREKLMSVTIPDTVTSIGSSAFDNCSGLTSVTIGNSVTNLGDYTFYNCRRLVDIVFNGNAPTIGNYTLSGVATSCCAHVRRASTGWEVDIPGTWNSIEIDYLEKMVVFDANGGEGGTNGLFDIGTEIVAPMVKRTGYTFSGWSPSVAAVVPTNDVTYTAQWTPNKYHVVFDANGGTGGWSREMDFDTSINAPTVMKTAYTFDGWLPDVDDKVPASNVTYTAQWVPNQYTVTFNANGGEGGMSVKQDYGTAIVVPTVTRTGYTFMGWTPSVAATVPAYNVTYRAQWELNKYTVTFTAGSGAYDTWTATINHGTTVGELPTPTRTNATFLGWFTAAEGGTLIDGLTVITEAMALYAHWLTLEEALGVSNGVTVATSATIPWKPILDSGAKVGDATARSGAIGDRTNTWMSATVSGAGTMSFWCKVSCEHDDDNTFTWDRLMVYTNDVEITDWRMDGETDWTQRALSFDGGTNTVRWVYFKDRSVSEGEDCAWVDGITWTPRVVGVTVDVGGGKSVSVPGEWLAAYEGLVQNNGGDVVKALASKAANGRLSVVECYLLGLDPENETNDFRIVSFPMKADGTPDLANIVFDPPQEQWNVPATYKLKGAATPAGPWADVEDGGDGAMGASRPTVRFFKVEVLLP